MVITKKSRSRLLQLCNCLLSGFLVLLGFSSCTREGSEEYGMPYAKYEIKGKVTNEQKETIPKAQVIVKQLDSSGKSFYRADTLNVNGSGEYQYLTEGFTESYRVIAEEPSGVYKADSTDVKMESKGGSGWYVGSDSKEVDFELKKK